MAETIEEMLRDEVMINAIAQGNLLFKGTTYLEHLIALLRADPETQRDYAAICRAHQLIATSKSDADFVGSRKSAASNMEQELLLISELASVVGNNTVEESRLQRATRILYKCTQADGGTAKLFSQTWAQNEGLDRC